MKTAENKQCFYRITKCFAVSKVTTRVPMLSMGIDSPQSFYHSFIALSIIRCAKSTHPLFRCVK